MNPTDTIHNHLAFLYGPHRGQETLARLERIMAAFRETHPKFATRPRARFSERDALLITYGDQFRTDGQAPLGTLSHVLEHHLGAVSGVHILPFYPYTSDDGFSVVDYHQIDPALGGWPDVERIAANHPLMVDAVVNHVSASSAWFQAFLQDDPKYREYFTVVDPNTDLSGVFRPRALPLLTAFDTPSGTKHVWTTFSADQVDLNFKNPDVLLDVLESLLLYVHHGATLIRLDAVGFIWKEIGTRCIHLEGAHRIVKLMRSVMDEVAPFVTLVTETNVPHVDNIAYFGQPLETTGTDEAQMVYQFPLPPLVLHTFRTGDATALTTWLRGLEERTPGTAFFNFLASHDGIGVVPATGLISPEDIQALAAQVEQHGGKVNYRNTPEGPKPYELCTTLFDALNDPHANETEDLQISRFIAANAILLALQGVPGIYVHSLFGSPSDHAELAASGINRRLNRHKFTLSALESSLNDPHSRAAKVLARYSRMLKARASHAAFAPDAPQHIVPMGQHILAIQRGHGDASVLCLINVSAQRITWGLEPTQFPPHQQHDLISGRVFDATITLEPYEVLWLG